MVPEYKFKWLARVVNQWDFGRCPCSLLTTPIQAKKREKKDSLFSSHPPTRPADSHAFIRLAIFKGTNNRQTGSSTILKITTSPSTDSPSKMVRWLFSFLTH